MVSIFRILNHSDEILLQINKQSSVGETLQLYLSKGEQTHKNFSVLCFFLLSIFKLQ